MGNEKSWGLKGLCLGHYSVLAYDNNSFRKLKLAESILATIKLLFLPAQNLRRSPFILNLRACYHLRFSSTQVAPMIEP